jgi:hypothetical protein
MYRLPGEVETLEIYERFERAIELRKPVTITFMKVRRDAGGAEMRFPDGRPYLVKVTRTVEPFELMMTRAGHLIVRVVDRSPNAAERPEKRTIRLDRVVISCVTQRARLVTHLSGRYLCPSPLDEPTIV